MKLGSGPPLSSSADMSSLARWDVFFQNLFWDCCCKCKIQIFKVLRVSTVHGVSSQGVPERILGLSSGQTPISSLLMTYNASYMAPGQSCFSMRPDVESGFTVHLCGEWELEQVSKAKSVQAISLEEDKFQDVKKMAKLLFGEESPVSCYASHRLLNEDRTYFKQVRRPPPPGEGRLIPGRRLLSQSHLRPSSAA